MSVYCLSRGMHALLEKEIRDFGESSRWGYKVEICWLGDDSQREKRNEDSSVPALSRRAHSSRGDRELASLNHAFP